MPWLIDKESGAESTTEACLARMDRKRKGETLSNKGWRSPVDPDAKTTKRKDDWTHLAYKPKHDADLDTGAVVAVVVHEAGKGDSMTLPKKPAAARECLGRATPAPPCPDGTADLEADKEYSPRDGLKELDGGPGRTRIGEPKRNGLNF